MRLRRALAGTLAAWLSTIFGGCTIIEAELGNRGGFSDKILDRYWFKADNKEMRVLRSYVLIGSLLRISSRTFTAPERQAMSMKVNVALKHAEEAFVCAYQGAQAPCVFFDDRMADLDRSLLHLAVAVLASDEDQALMAQIQKKIIGDTALGSLLSATVKVAEAGAEVANATSKAASLVAGLLKLSEQAISTGHRFGALYRDSIELDMVVVLRSLEDRCKAAKTGLTCEVYHDGLRLYRNGSGTVGAWRAYLTNPIAAGQYAAYAIPSQLDFVQATELIFRSCENLIDAGSKVGSISFQDICKGRNVTVSKAPNNQNGANAKEPEPQYYALFYTDSNTWRTGLRASAQSNAVGAYSPKAIFKPNHSESSVATSAAFHHDKYWKYRCGMIFSFDRSTSAASDEERRFCLKRPG